MINAGIGPGSVFARVKTAEGYKVSGIEPVDPQEISDGIANSVLGAVVGERGNKITLDEIYGH